ncbi:MAG TPA: hypothetical protein VGB94_02275 [Acidobacteriaceae bacterium]
MKPQTARRSSPAPAKKPAGNALHRTVILLRDHDRKRLDMLRESEGVSAAEILRRSLHSYQPATHPGEESLIEATMDRIIATLHDASRSAERSEKRLDQLQRELARNRTVESRKKKRA